MTNNELEDIAQQIEAATQVGPIMSDEDDYWVAGMLYAAKLVRLRQSECDGPCINKGQFDAQCGHVNLREQIAQDLAQAWQHTDNPDHLTYADGLADAVHIVRYGL
jgi:hypothetical protein